MNKLYTITLGAMVAFSASAIQPAQHTLAADLQATPAQKAVLLNSIAKKSLKAPKAQTLPDITGSWFLSYTSNQWGWNHLVPMTISKADEGGPDDYVIDGFLFSDSEPVPCKYALTEVQFADSETREVPMISIPGNGQVKLFTGWDFEDTNLVDWMLYLSEVKDGKWYLYTDDIMISVNENETTGELELKLFYEECTIAYVYKNGETYSGRRATINNFSKPNGTMEFCWPNDDGNVECEISGKLEGNNLTITNFGLLPCPITFVCDFANGTAVAENQVGAIYKEYTNSDDNTDYLLSDFETREAVVMATFTNDLTAKTSRVNIETNEWCVYSKLDRRYFNYTTGGVINLPFILEGDSQGAVNDVIIDNANAPVEYFNLQGVRVVEPAAGLYIRRQGNNISKVIVK